VLDGGKLYDQLGWVTSAYFGRSLERPIAWSDDGAMMIDQRTASLDSLCDGSLGVGS
jgi:hypothetical protein